MIYKQLRCSRVRVQAGSKALYSNPMLDPSLAMEILVQPRREREKSGSKAGPGFTLVWGERPGDLEELDCWVLDWVIVQEPLLPSSPPPLDSLCCSLPTHPFLISGAGLNL